MGRRLLRGRQVPSLSPHDTFHLDGCHVSMSHQVPKGYQVPSVRQVPSLISCGTLRLNSRHVSMGRQVPSSH